MDGTVVLLNSQLHYRGQKDRNADVTQSTHFSLSNIYGVVVEQVLVISRSLLIPTPLVFLFKGRGSVMGVDSLKRNAK